MSGCDCLDVGVFGWYVCLVMVGEEEEGAGIRRGMDVKEQGQPPTRGAAPQRPSLQVNHGGVSKRPHTAETGPISTGPCVERGRGVKGWAALVVNQNKKDLKNCARGKPKSLARLA